MHNKLKLSITRALQLGTAVGLAVACSASSTDQNQPGAAGATVGNAGSASGGKSSGGAPAAAAGMPTFPAAGGGAAGSAPVGPAGSGGTPVQTGTGGTTSTGGAPVGGTTSAGGTAGKGSAGGSSVAGGSSAGSTGAAGGSSGSCPNGATAQPCPPTEPNSIAYIGCSMADNIGQGYGQVGGKIMWNNSGYGTGAKVVENWGPNGDAWSLFTTKLAAIGGKDKVKAIMVQICVLSTHSEDNVKAMIKAARDHVNPGTHIYIVGQPSYEAGHSCFLAGNGGAEWTEATAQKMAMDSSVNQDMTYLGQFKLDTTKNESSDGCHASATGLTVLGNQARAFWGG
ncbi:MAG TPA: hypothetical protein VFK05_08210 [Polyangiaceae bacterium]|nr:hypothetical protein [Polyangiaceae bacterium]